MHFQIEENQAVISHLLYRLLYQEHTGLFPPDLSAELRNHAPIGTMLFPLAGHGIRQSIEESVVED